MPPKKCGRCEKTVYPTEELKCLDKVGDAKKCTNLVNMSGYHVYCPN